MLPIFDHAKPLALALIVIEPAPTSIVIPVPAVNVAATGMAPVDPTINWPLVNGPTHVGTPVDAALVTNTELNAGARPVTVLAVPL